MKLFSFNKVIFIFVYKIRVRSHSGFDDIYIAEEYFDEDNEDYGYQGNYTDGNIVGELTAVLGHKIAHTIVREEYQSKNGKKYVPCKSSDSEKIEEDADDIINKRIDEKDFIPDEEDYEDRYKIRFKR